jgi:PKD repeat protein
MNKPFILSLFIFPSFLIAISDVYGIDCQGNSSFTFPSTGCIGMSISVTNTSNGPDPDTLIWKWGDLSQTIVTDNFHTPVTHTYMTTGTFTIWMIRICNPNGRDSISHQITIGVMPTASFTFTPNNVCGSVPIVFMSNSTPPSGLTYSWNFNDPASGSNNTSNLQNPTHIFQQNIIGNGIMSYNVSLTVTTPGGCSNSVSHLVTLKQIPDDSLTDILNIPPFLHCSNSPEPFSISVSYMGTTTLTNTAYSIVWGDGSPSWNSSSPPIGVNHTYAIPNTFYLDFTVTGNNGCSNTRSYLVFNGSNPSLTIGSPGSTTGCTPVTFTFPIGGFAGNTPSTVYTFDFGDGTPPVVYTTTPPSTISHTYTTSSCGLPNNSFVLNATASNPCGTTPLSVGSIHVSSQPGANFSISPSPACVNSLVTFTNLSNQGCNIIGQTAFYNATYEWDFGDGSPPVIFNNITNPAFASTTHTYTSPGIYTVSLKGSNPQCGDSILTQTLCVNPGMSSNQADFSINPNTGCIPLTVSTNNISSLPLACTTPLDTWSVAFNGSSCSPSGGSWQFQTGYDLHSINPVFIFNDPGEYAITLTYSNNCGSDTAQRMVYVKTKPIVSLEALTGICAGGTVTPTATYESCFGTISSYLWSFPGGSPTNYSGPAPPPITYSTPGNYTISVTVTNECGQTTASTPLTVNAMPTPTLSGPTPVCVNTSGNVYTTQTGMNNYQWSVSPGGTITAEGTATSNTVIVTWNTVGTQTVSINYSAGGCPALAPYVFTVTVNPLPTPTITGSSSVCIGANGVIYTTEPGMTGYAWSVSSGGIITSGANTNQITVTWNTAGPQTVSVNYSNSFGCSALAATVYNVTVNPLPAPTISGPLTVCVGSTSNVYSTQTGMTNYSWTVSSGGTITAGGTSNSNTVTVMWNTAGPQTVCVNYTDAAGCTAVSPVCIPITVNTIPVPAISGPLQVCENSTGNVYSTDPGMSNYQWSVSSGGIITSGGGTNSVTVTWNSLGPQTVSVTYVQSGCPSANPTVVNVMANPRPIPTITGPVILCAGATGAIYTTESGMSIYAWTISGGGTITSGSGTNSVTVTWNLPGPQSVSVTYTNSFGCPAISPTGYNVTVNPLPIPSISGPATVCEGTANNVYTSQPGMTNYIWNITGGGTVTAGGTTASNAVTVTWNTAGSQSVSLIYTNSNGCTASPAFVYPVTVNPLPVFYVVSGGGSYCSGGIGVPVGLLNSQAGATYQLYRNGAAVGTPVNGTGGPISFGNQTIPGIYKIQGTITTTGCTTWMADSTAVSILPLPLTFTVTGGGSYPAGGIGVPIGLSGSQAGINYRLIHETDTLTPLPGVPGTGGPISFGNQTLAGNYTVIAKNALTGCVILMNGSVSITINPYPSVFNVYGGGDLCAGDPGKEVGLDGSEVGIEYVLRRNGDSLTMLPGTGDSLFFGIFIIPGTYTVIGKNITTGLLKMMNGSAVIIVNPLPLVYLVVPAGDTCPGTEIFLNGSQAGILYSLIRGYSDTIVTLPGTGMFGLLSFGFQYDTGVYRAVALNPLTGCRNNMNGTVTIHPAPAIFDMSPLGIICPGTEITLSGSQIGILYQLRRDSLTNVGPALPGTGFPLNFGPQSEPGVYTVVATNPLTSCYSWMNYNATIQPSPTMYTIVPNGDTCAGALIRLNGSQMGLLYELLLDSTIHLNTMMGTGQPLVFGTYYTAGVYNIVAVNPSTLCETVMDSSLTISQAPVVYNLYPNGIVCAGYEIGLENSEPGVAYTLIRDGNIVVAGPVYGTGLPISFGTQYYPGLYTIEAEDTATGCHADMAGIAELHPRPQQFLVQPLGSHCAGTDIYLNGSETGVLYTLLRDGIFQSSAYGTGAILHFGPQYLEGVYTVIGSNGTSSCDTSMIGSTTIVPLPLSFNIIPPGANCSPTEVQLDGSQTGFSYQLLKNGAVFGTPITGTGSAITFGFQMEGFYQVVATNPITSCTDTMAGTVVITGGPVANAGNDTTICALHAIALSGHALNYSTVQWTTSGDGLFDNPTQMDVIYTPGQMDILNGSVNLFLLVYGTPQCLSVTDMDTIVVHIDPLPIANAGADDTTCVTLPYQLNGIAQNYSAVLWLTSGDGSYDNPNVLNPIYTLGPLDEQNSSVILILRTTGTLICSQDYDFDSLRLVIQPLPIAYSGPSDTICENDTYRMNGSSLYSSSILWATSGDGSFDDPTLPGAAYTPGTNDKTIGYVDLIITAFGLATCSITQDQDTMRLFIEPLPDVNSGPDAIICENGTYTLAGSMQYQSSLLWTSTGDGIYDDPTILTPVYTPGPTDIINGSVTLILSGFGSQTCSGEVVPDSLLLSFYPMPQADAGLDTTACPNIAIPLNGSATQYLSVLWTSLGDGLFNNPAIFNPTYTPGSGDILSGSATLLMTVNGLMECSSQTDTDTIQLTFRTLPTVSVSGTPVICEEDTAVITLTLTGIPPWNIQYTDGLSVITISNIPTTPYYFYVTPPANTTYTVLGLQDAYCTGVIQNSTATVIVNPIPEEYPMAATNGGGFCEGGSGVEIIITGSQTGVFYQLLFGGQPSGFPQPGTGGPISFGYTSTPGLYEVKGTFSQTLCETLFSDSILVVMFLTPDINFTADSACIGEPTYFYLEGLDISKIALWEWNFGDGTTATYTAPIGPSHIYPVPGQYLVTLFVTDTNNCTKTISHPVSVNTLPISLFSHDAPMCQGLFVTFTDHSYTTSNNYLKTWHWDFGDGHDTLVTWPNNPNVSHQYISPGIYPVTLTVTTNESCSALRTRNVQIDPAPVSNFDYSNPCDEEIVQFNDLSQTAGGGAVVEWYWNFGDPGSGINNFATIQNPVHIYSQPGSYIVSLAIMNSHGCFDTIVKTVAVQSGPVAMFDADVTCLFNPTQFNDLSIPNATSIIEWDWDFGDGSAHSNLQNPIHNYLTAGDYNVTLTVKNSNLCTHDTTIQVSVISLPIASYQSNAPQCTGSPVYYMNLSTSQHGQIVKWVWDFGDGSDTTIYYPGVPNVAHVFQGAGLQHMVRLTITTADSCTSFIEHVINSIPQPAANFYYSTVTCEGESVQFTDLTQLNGGGPITDWFWNFDDPTSGTQNISYLQNPVHIFTGPGTYDVRLIVTSLNSCIDTIVKTVSVNEQPEADFNADTACIGTPTVFTDLSLANAASITTWDWDFGDGTPHSHIQNPIHLYAQSGIYNVTLAVINSNGCTASVSRLVKVNPAPVALFAYSSGNCSGSPVSFYDLSYTSQGYIAKWVWDFGDGNTVTITTPGSQNVTHIYTNAGNYNVTLTIQTNDSCSSSIVHTIPVTASPMANFTYAATRCQQSPVQFQDLTQQNGGGTIISWNWNFGDPGSGTNNTSNLQNPVHTYQGSGTFQVTLIVTNLNNCKDTIVNPVDINGIPSVDFSADSVCQGDTTHFTDLTVPNSGTLIAWLWYFGDGGTSTQQNPVHYYSASGSYQVTLTVTNSYSCTSDTLKMVQVKVPPVSQFTYENNCVGAGTQFTDGSTPGFGSIIQWHWDFGDGDTSNLQNPIHVYTNNGTFTVVLTVTNSLGCTDEYSLPVTIYAQPTALFTAYSTYCPRGTVTFADHSIPSGAPIVSWYWIFEDGFFSTSSNPTYTYSITDTTYQVTLIITDENGCMDTIVDDVYVVPGFSFSFTADSACFGNATHFGTLNLAAGDTLHDLYWNFGDPQSGTYNTSTLYYPTHTFTQPQVYIVKLRAYNSNNCVDSVYKEIVVHPGPIADFGFDSIPYCDSTVVFTNLSIGNNADIDTLIWQFGDGTTSTQTPPLPPTISHLYGNFGSFDVSLTAVNGNGCRSSITKPLLVTCIASAFMGLDTLNCQKQAVTFIDSSGPVSLIGNWYWDFGDGEDTVYSTFKPTIAHEYDTDGEYTVRLVVSFISNGVTISDTSWQTLFIRRAPVASFLAPTVCYGDTTRFVNLSDSNGTAIVYKHWQFGDTPSGNNDTSSLTNPVHLYTHHGAFNVNLIIGSSNGCYDNLEQLVRVYQVPSAEFSNTLACSMDNAWFYDSSLPGDTSLAQWRWHFNDPWHPYDTISLQNTSYNYYDAGNYTVFLRISDHNGCSDTISKNIEVILSPTSRFAVSEEFDGIPGKIRLTNQSENYNGFEWDFGNGTSSDAENPIVTYTEGGSYTIRLVTWNADCYDTTDFVYDFIFHGLFVPNAFAPTSIILGPKLFKPVGLNLEKYHVMVFDIFGRLMWESTELDDEGRPEEGWDGYVNGELQTQGTYVWKITATFKDGKTWEGSNNGKSEPSVMGTVTLVR